MTSEETPEAAECPVSAIYRPQISVAMILVAGFGLQGCTSVLPRQNYEPIAPPPLETLSERVAEERSKTSPDAEGKQSNLPDWVAYALENSPRITSAIAEYEMAANQVPQATALPDPRLSYRYFLEEVETRAGAQQYAIGIAQPLPWLGKLRLQGEVASQKAHAAAARVSTTQNEIIADVASAWYELYYFDRALEIMRGNRDLVVHLERVARTRYGAGATGHPDVIRAQVELGKIENDLASLADREAPLLAHFNAALNRPSNAPIEMPKDAPIVRIPKKDSDLVQRVIENNPEFQALIFDIEAATAAKKRAKKEFFPDFSVGIEFIATDEALTPNVPGSGNDPVAAFLTMTLPIQRGKYRAGVRAAQAFEDGEQARRDQFRNSLEAATINALFRLRDAERQVDLYQTTLLPKANESLMATQRAYSAGASTFADLIDAQRALLVFELAEVRAIADHNLARTTLEELMGAPIEAAETKQENRNER